jgi:Holliday junction resolvase
MDEKKRKQGKSSREKGARFERELSKLFNEYGFNTHRGYVQFKQSDVIGLEGIHIEAKAVERLNPWAALQQATEEAEKRKDGMPAVFWKRSRKGIMVCMSFDDFMTLYKIARGKGYDANTNRNCFEPHQAERGDNIPGGV